LKFGGDYRLIGMRVFAPGSENGFLDSTANFTQGPDPNVGGTNAGDSIASLLLGFPARGAFPIATPNPFPTRSSGGRNSAPSPAGPRSHAGSCCGPSRSSKTCGPIA
jgi:hypothetical protein